MTAAVLVLVVLGGVVLAAVGWAVVSAATRSFETRMDARLGTTDAELRRLGDATLWRERGDERIREEVSAFRGALELLRAREEERRAREEQGWAILQRVAAVLSGGQRAGRAGENVLREALAHLPPSMVVTDFRVNGRVVEFGLVLPDGRRLPIDSKWPADRELQLLEQTRDQDERDRLVRVVERAVAERAREVAGYLDPAVTAPVGVAAVPDAAYSVLRRAHADAYRQGVIVVPYSMALPVLLFLHGLVSRFGSPGDVQACLGDLAAMLDAIEGTVENKLARASTMIANGTEELRGHVGKLRGTLSRAQRSEGDGEGLDRPSVPEADPVARPRLVGIPP